MTLRQRLKRARARARTARRRLKRNKVVLAVSNKRVKNLRAAIERKRRLENAWGGSQRVAEEAIPIASRLGIGVTSTKRAASHPLSQANPDSDHNEANTTAYAIDFGTFSGETLARQLGQHYGFPFVPVGTFASHTITRDGKRYRVQVLWAVVNHFNHVHVGVKRA